MIELTKNIDNTINSRREDSNNSMSIFSHDNNDNSDKSALPLDDSQEIVSDKSRLKLTLKNKESTADTNEIINDKKILTKLSKPKIEVRLWLMPKGGKPKYINSVFIKASETKAMYKGKQFKVIVDSPAFKEGKDCYIYDCDINNTVGGLGFHKPDIELTAKATATLLKDENIEATFGRGGLPIWLFAILAIGTVAGIFVAVIAVPQMITKGEQLDTVKAELQQYKTFYPPPPRPQTPDNEQTVTRGLN